MSGWTEDLVESRLREAYAIECRLAGHGRIQEHRDAHGLNVNITPIASLATLATQPRPLRLPSNDANVASGSIQSD